MAGEQPSIFLCLSVTLIGTILTPAIFCVTWLYVSLSAANFTAKRWHTVSITDNKLRVNSTVVYLQNPIIRRNGLILTLINRESYICY